MARNTQKQADVDQRVVAYRKYKSDLINAWKFSEFRQVLHFAVVIGSMKPLATFLTSDKPLARSDRRALAGFVRSLEKRKQGRPPGPSPGDVPAALRNAVYLVRLGQQSWLRKHNRQRVPPSVTNELIPDAIKVASSAFKVPAAKIGADDIHRLLSKK
jgi:hypothetical protein